MKTKTLRTIAELNLSPIMRLSSSSVMAVICILVSIANIGSNFSILFLALAVFFANRHILWDNGRHQKRKSRV